MEGARERIKDKLRMVSRENCTTFVTAERKGHKETDRKKEGR